MTINGIQRDDTHQSSAPRLDIHSRGLPTELRGLHVLEREDVQAPLLQLTSRE